MKTLSVVALALLASCTHRTASDPASSPRVHPEAATAEDVVWTQLVNATASGSSLAKSGGQPGLDDAGATSAQTLSAGDGWLEFTVADTQPFRFVGLGRPHAGTSGAAIDYELRLQAGRADVYESGAWKADDTVVAGDLLRIAVAGGAVAYYKNGALVYTSAVAPQYPLAAYAALVDAGATVTGARIAADASSPAGDVVSGVHAEPSADGTGAVVTWTTAVAADGQVQYGPTTAYGTWSVYAPTAATSHSITLTDLVPGTAYHYRVRSEDAGGNAVLSADASFTAAGAPPPTANRHRFCGWLMATGYVPIDQDPNYADFVAHASDFDAVHPTWYHLASPTTLAASFGEGAAAVLANTTAGGKRTLLIPTIAAADGAQPSWASQMLHDASLRAAHEDAIVALVTHKGYDGIDLDYEHLPDGDRDLFSEFAAELAAKLHAGGKTLSFAVGALTSARYSHWDYDKLSAVADQLHVMGYDYHYLGSHPGPVAPLGWIEQVLAYIDTVGGGGRAGKFILGLPNYGLAGDDSGVTTWYGSGMDCINLVNGTYDTTTTHMSVCPLTNGVPIAAGRAPNAMSPKGHLFFDDLASFEEKISAAQQARLGGITYWTIGGEPDRPGPRTFFELVRSYFPQ